VTLSFQRANRAAQMLETVNPDVTTRIQNFEARGNHDYIAAETDDSAFWRAVEVHIFLDDPPPPPPHLDPPPPCPGGRRYRKWSIATPVGFIASPIPGTAAGANIVVFRRDEGPSVTRTYICPAVGGGASYAGPNVTGLLKFAQVLWGGISISGMAWSPVVAETPFNFGDLDGATCAIVSGGAGGGPGYQLATVSVSGKVWFRDSTGKCMFMTRDFFTNVDTSGKDIQFGVGVSGVGGPLLKM